MRYAEIFLLVVLVFSKNAFSSERSFTIEDTSLRDVDEKIYAAIKGDASFISFGNLGCKLIGEKISLTSLPIIKTYFVTTSNACGWGSALGPIWIVDELKRKVIFNAGGYSLEIKRSTRNGFRDIGVSSGTAGMASSSHYRFDGNKYISERDVMKNGK